MRITAAERLLGMLGYLPLVCLLVVRLKRDSIFVQFHARQGSVLFVMWLALMVLLFLALLFVPASSTLASNVLFGAIALVSLVYLVMMVFTMLFKVALGERYRMPIVADVALMLRL
jgi:uncharacterized membrane protein